MNSLQLPFLQKSLRSFRCSRWQRWRHVRCRRPWHHRYRWRHRCHTWAARLSELGWQLRFWCSCGCFSHQQRGKGLRTQLALDGWPCQFGTQSVKTLSQPFGSIGIVRVMISLQSHGTNKPGGQNHDTCCKDHHRLQNNCCRSKNHYLGDWLMRTSAGNPGYSHQLKGFPVDVPINQPSDYDEIVVYQEALLENTPWYSNHDVSHDISTYHTNSHWSQQCHYTVWTTCHSTFPKFHASPARASGCLPPTSGAAEPWCRTMDSCHFPISF